jgi:4-hydroxybenzoate polyprenyltransferase
VHAAAAVVEERICPGRAHFSGEAPHVWPEIRAWTTFVAFCLMSGATYLLNDAKDAEADRLNPRTGGPADRAGRSALVNWKTLLTVAGFLVLQFAYSIWLKHLLFVDVMAISAGFVRRTFAGLVCIPVVISPWLLLCTGLLALFLELARRCAAAVSFGGTAHLQRPVLEGCSVALLES